MARPPTRTSAPRRGLGTKKDVTNENRESYLRYDLSSFTGPLVAATFRLMPTFDGYAYVTNNVDLVSSNAWSETTTTWNNKPAVSTSLATVVNTQATPTKVNVTTQAGNSLAGDKKLSLHVGSNTTNTNGLTLFGSREHVDPTFTPCWSSRTWSRKSPRSPIRRPVPAQARPRRGLGCGMRKRRPGRSL
jgi:hypothetical protein